MLLTKIQKLYLVHFLLKLHFIGGVLIPFLTDFGKISFTQIMILQSWFMFWIFIFEIPTGAIADFFGRRNSMVLSGVITAAAAIIYASYPNFYVFLAGELLWALAAALMSGADTAMVYDTLKEEKREKQSKEILSRYESFGLAGIFIGSPVGSIIAATLGVRAPMFLMAIPMLLGSALLLTTSEPKNFKTAKKESYIKILRDGISFFSGHKILKVLALDLVVVAALAWMMIWLFQPLLKESGVPVLYYGFVHAGFVLAQIFVLNKISQTERLFGGRKNFLFFSTILTGTAFLLSGITKIIPLVLLSIFVIGAFGLTRRPVMDSYVNKYIPTAKRATILSTISMLRGMIIAALYLVVGFAVDRFSLSYTLLAIGGLLVAFAFFSKIEEKMLKD